MGFGEGFNAKIPHQKGGLTWIKSHLPTKYFGDYNLKNVVAALAGESDIRLKQSLNVVIRKYNDVHRVSSIATESTNQPASLPAARLQKLPFAEIMSKAEQYFEGRPRKHFILQKLERCLEDYDPSSNETYNIFLGGVWEETPPPTLAFQLIRPEIDDAIAHFLSLNNFPGIAVPNPVL